MKIYTSLWLVLTTALILVSTPAHGLDTCSYFGPDRLGLAYVELGKYASAFSAFQKQISECPENPAAYFHMGRVLQFLGRKDEAAAFYAKVKTLNGNYRPCETYNLARAYEDMGFLQDAAAVYDLLKAQDLSSARCTFSQTGDIFYDLGRAYVRLGRTSDALPIFLKAFLNSAPLPDIIRVPEFPQPK